jgi:hypothetical protein
MSLADEIDAVGFGPPGRRKDLEYSDDVIPLVSEFGIARRFHSSEPVEEELAALREFIASVGDPSNAVFMDSTTLFTVSAMLGLTGEKDPDDYVSANTLLDLDTFVRCAILYDRILCLPNDAVEVGELNRAIGAEVVSTLPLAIEEYATPGVVGALTDLFDDVQHDVNWLARAEPGTAEHDDLEELNKAWERVLGRELAVADLFWPQRSQQWGSIGSQIVRQLLASQSQGRVTELTAEMGVAWEWAEFIDECNVRCLFNTRVAGLLGLPYAPNNARLPYRFHLLRNAAVAHDHFLDVAEVQRALQEQTASYVRPYTLELPLFLASVLARASRLDDLLREVGQLRADGEAYRARRRELLDAIWRGDTRTVDRLQEAVQADTRAWRGLLRASPTLAVIGVLTATGFGLAAMILTSLKLIKVGEDLDPAARAGLFRRTLRPEEWFLTKVGTLSRELVNGLPTLQALWRLTNEHVDICRRGLERLSGLDEAWPARNSSSN